MDFTTTIQISQMIVNELAGSSFVHKMQGQLFKSQGFTKLCQKYMDHYTEEMGWVEKYTDRLLDLGVVPEVKVSSEAALIEDPKAYLLDEEEDLYWDEEQLGLIEKIGYQNWLVKQL